MAAALGWDLLEAYRKRRRERSQLRGGALMTSSIMRVARIPTRAPSHGWSHHPHTRPGSEGAASLRCAGTNLVVAVAEIEESDGASHRRYLSRKLDQTRFEWRGPSPIWHTPPQYGVAPPQYGTPLPNTACPSLIRHASP